jgi:hypothetical protein
MPPVGGRDRDTGPDPGREWVAVAAGVLLPLADTSCAKCGGRPMGRALPDPALPALPGAVAGGEVLWREGLMAVACTHLKQIKITETEKDYCEDCIKTGDSWLHLRMCLSCGHVGCCDSSPNRHASKHFRRSGHPLMRSVEPGEGWIWCFVDEVVPGELPPTR